MTHLKQIINSVSIETQHIDICFSDFWYQEDIEALKLYVFQIAGETKVIEHILGADRENIRFVWKNQYNFVLNFDCYSQSCWLESEDELSAQELIPLFENLKDGLGNR